MLSCQLLISLTMSFGQLLLSRDRAEVMFPLIWYRATSHTAFNLDPDLPLFRLGEMRFHRYLAAKKSHSISKHNRKDV